MRLKYLRETDRQKTRKQRQIQRGRVRTGIILGAGTAGDRKAV